MKQNGVTDDAIGLYLFPYSLTHHAIAWLTLRHRGTINAAAGGTFMKRRPEECYDLIENITAHHNDWDTSAHRGESSSSTTSSSSEISALAQQMIEMRKDMLQMADNQSQSPYTVVKVLSGPSVLPPPLSSSSKEVEREPETIMDQMFKKLHFNISLADALALMPKYAKMLKDILSDEEKLLGLANTSLTKNCSAVLLRKLPEKLGDPGKFLIPCDFPELEKCMALADLGASINLMPLSVWKKLMLPELIPTRMTLELANRSIAYPAGIVEDVCVQVVDVYGEELILRDGDEKLIFHAGSTSKHPQKHGNESINMINFIDITCEDHFPKVLNIKKSNHPFSGSTTSPFNSSPSLTHFETSDSLFEEFADKLALLDPFPLRNEDDNFDPEADLREIEFADEPALVYLSPSGEDDDDNDDLFDLKSDNDEWKKWLYGDHFNDTHSEKDNIKDSKIKILIDELESPESNVLPPQLLASDSTLPKESSEIATLLSSPFGNEDKVFNPGLLIMVRTQIFNDESKYKDYKVNTSSEALSILEERNFLSISSDLELLFHLKLTVIETLLSFSSENEDKVFNPGILTSKGVHSLTLDLSHRTYETFKIINVHPNIFNEGPMKIFPFFCFCPKEK
ncbi:reverse transcriptase domain-containing protein [Tanacetum coccineum]